MENTPITEPELSVSPESFINVLGVTYVHTKTSDGGDLYLTRFGLPLAKWLEIDNWYERSWFEQHRQRLEGTGSVFRVPTKPVDEKVIDLVVKNCRMGEDVPLDTHTLQEFINAEFNSPWEEFSLVMEMRENRFGPADLTMHTQEPLAIYVPPERLQIWQTGRSIDKMNRITARHPGIDLDILRQYKLIYRWIDGRNVVEAFCDIGLTGNELMDSLKPITAKAIADLDKKGYAVADMKPAHIIIWQYNIVALRNLQENGELASKDQQADFIRHLVLNGRYSVVDYELLLRTPPNETEVKSTRRHWYLDHQRDRFTPAPMPPHLRALEIMGVPYICGNAESTSGILWVVGRDPNLFDYFLPERWRRTPSKKLSENNEVYYTLTKDNIHVVWKTSRVGETPAIDPKNELATRIQDYGFNSPFEEFSIALYLNAQGIATVYPRAIYQTGSVKLEQSTDLRRYEEHRHLLMPDRTPMLRHDRNYITIRGYYNGPDTWIAEHESQFYKPYDLSKAMMENILTQSECAGILKGIKQRLKKVGYDGTLLDGSDVLVILDPSGQVVKDSDGMPEARICNFELLRKI